MKFSSIITFSLFPWLQVTTEQIRQYKFLTPKSETQTQTQSPSVCPTYFNDKILFALKSDFATQVLKFGIGMLMKCLNIHI